MSGLIATSAVVAGRAQPTTLTSSLADDATVVVHVRDVSKLTESWQYTPLARMWSEPEVQRFFAPAIAKLSGEGSDDFIARMKAETGFSPREMLGLFSGELVIAVLDLPRDSSDPNFVIGTVVGENRAEVESLIARTQEAEGASSLTEEFQGETLNLGLRESAEGEPEVEMTWAFVGDVLWLANTKETLQRTIANMKKGGAANPLTTAPGFAAVYRHQPDAQFAFYLNLEAVVRGVIAQIDSRPPNEDGTPAGPFAQMGIPTDVAFDALGLTALRSLYAGAAIQEAASTWTFGVNWTEQRGLLKMIAYGDAPAPRPSFASGDWYTVTASRFSIATFFDAVKETVNALNPGLGGMMEQQILQINQQLGIDLERDFFGSFGDEILQASNFAENTGDMADPLGAEQLIALSLANPDAIQRSIDGLVGMVPPQFQEWIKPRDYLGVTINDFGAPAGGETTFAYAVVRNHLLVGIGSAAMIETAIQNFDRPADSLWNVSGVGAALAALPGGSSAVSYSDLRKGMAIVFASLAEMAQSMEELAALDEEGDGDSDGPEEWIDPSAVPSREVIEKYWSTAVGALYRDPDGLRSVGRIPHGE